MLDESVEGVSLFLDILNKFHLSAAHHAVISPAIGTRSFRSTLDELINTVHLEIYVGIVAQKVYFSTLHSAMQIKNQDITPSISYHRDVKP